MFTHEEYGAEDRLFVLDSESAPDGCGFWHVTGVSPDGRQVLASWYCGEGPPFPSPDTTCWHLLWFKPDGDFLSQESVGLALSKHHQPSPPFENNVVI